MKGQHLRGIDATIVDRVSTEMVRSSASPSLRFTVRQTVPRLQHGSLEASHAYKFCCLTLVKPQQFANAAYDSSP